MCICFFAYIFKKRINGTIKPKPNKIIIYGEGKEWDEGDRDGSETSVKVLYNTVFTLDLFKCFCII